MSDTRYKIQSLDDIRGAVATLPVMDVEAANAARDRQNTLTKPPGSLGQLEYLAEFMAGWLKTATPTIDVAQAVVFAGNHGVCAQGVNPYPQEVTAQMVGNFQAGGAAINQLCKANNAELSVVALDLETPTGDFTQGPALSTEELVEAINQGAKAVNPASDILLLGEMGIGNSTVAAALTSAIFGGDVQGWVGPGTGSDPEGIARKVSVIEAGLKLHSDHEGDALGQLAAFGGREQAAICGAVLAARSYNIPVVLDGYICTAAAAVLYGVDPALLDHCLVGHASAEPGHKLLLDAINKKPILQFDMRLGEGSGAALALGIIRSALACHNGMATFGEAGVSDA